MACEMGLLNVRTRFPCKAHGLQDTPCFGETVACLQKVCLGTKGLGKFWDQEQGKNLRVSTALQWMCLQDSTMPAYPDHKAVCQQWSNCLKRAKRFERMIKILRAKGSKHAPLPAQLTPTPTTTPTGKPTHNPTRFPSRIPTRNRARNRKRGRTVTALSSSLFARLRRNVGSFRWPGGLVSDLQQAPMPCTITSCVSVCP